MNILLRVANVTTLVAVFLMMPAAYAADYPVRPIRIIMPWAAGGGTDIMARLLGERFHAAFGQSVIVDNRTGAGGNIGHDMLAKSTPDGYTLMVSTAAVAINVSLYSKLPFNTSTDILPVSQIGSAPIVLTVHASSPARSVGDLVALSKTKSGLNFGSNGTGTASHLAGVMLNQVTHIPVVHIPYKGVAPALAALLSDEVDIAFPGVKAAAFLKREIGKFAKIVKAAGVKAD